MRWKRRSSLSKCLTGFLTVFANFTTGKHSRNSPYYSGMDFRLQVKCFELIMYIDVTGDFYTYHQWLEDSFLPYLDAWEQSVAQRTGFSNVQKKRITLSAETLLGLRITGNFIRIFTVNYVTFRCFVLQ